MVRKKGSSVFPPVLLLFLLLVGPSATFRFSFAADTRLDVYNAISRGGFFSQTWDVHQSRGKMRVRQVSDDHHSVICYPTCLIQC